MNSTEICVVGSGLGGLVLGALLARRGYQVAILEQHYLPGGCATTFRRHRYRFEVSLHGLDGLDPDDPKEPLFRELGLFENLPLVDLPRSEFYRFIHTDIDMVVPGSIDGAVEELTRAFPHERAGIRELFSTIREIRTEFSRLLLMTGMRRRVGMLTAPIRKPMLLRHWNTTVGDYLDALFDDELLKLLLVANTLYYHDDPRRFSLYWYAMSQGSFFTGGVHFVKGGSLVLAQRLAEDIRAHGGRVLTSYRVEEILVDRGRVSGVRYRKIRGRNLGEGLLQAHVVVANAPVPVVANDLVRDAAIEPYRRRVNRMKKSCSLLSLHLGFSRSPKDLGNRAYCTLIPGEGVNSLDDLRDEFTRQDWAAKGFEFVDYSHLDHGLAPAGKHVGVITLVDYLSNWAGLAHEEYRAQKREISELMIRKLDRLVPGLAAAIETYEMSTPLTIMRYTSNPGGCVYGFAQDPGQAVPFRLGHRSSVDNLFFASAWVTPGGGYSGAMLAGMSCARVVQRALRRNAPARSDRTSTDSTIPPPDPAVSSPLGERRY